MGVPVVAAPAGATVAAVGAEVGEADVGGGQAEQGAVGAVPVGVVVTTTEGGGGVLDGGQLQGVGAAVHGGLVGAHQVAGHLDGTGEGLQGDLHVHVALGAVEGALAVVARDLHHHLTVCAGEVGAGAVLLLGGVGGAEVVHHAALIVHDAAAHLGLDGQFLVQGCVADARDVRRALAVVVADAVDVVVAIVRHHLLAPGAVVEEKDHLAALDGEVAEAGVGAGSEGDEEDLDVSVLAGVEGVAGVHNVTKLVPSAQLVHHGDELVLEDLAGDGLGAVGLDGRLDGSDEVVVLCHKL